MKDKGVAGLIKLLHSLESAKQPEFAQSLKERGSSKQLELAQSLKERGREVSNELKSLHLLSFFSTRIY